MGEFEITRARPTLGFTPSSGVRANIDTRTGQGAVGAAVGQALVAGGQKALDIMEKRQQMTDANSNVTANKFRSVSDAEFEAFKLTNPQETWVTERERLNERVDGQIGSLEFSSIAGRLQQTKSQAISEVNSAEALTSATRQLRTDTIDALTNDMTAAFRTGDAKTIAESTRRFADNGDNMGKDKAEVLSDIQVSAAAGGKLRANDSANSVYASIELASGTNGDFSVARELAKNPAMPETRQATLFTAINTAESRFSAKVKAEQQELIDTTTSTTIREYYQGTMTVGELDKRHEAGLIKDTKFESMRKGLEASIPDVSDQMVRSEMNNAITQFRANQISREDTQNIFLDSYEFLDEPDRKKFDNDIEAVTTTLVENSMSEAKEAGKELISPKFQEFDPFGIKKFDNPEDERRFNLEWRLRNQYNDSLDEWKESQKDKVITPSDVRRMENDLLIDYRKIRSRGLDAIETAVSPTEGPPVPVTPLKESKTLRDISIERLKARREELKRQLK